jgi:signal transduction histidine kinase
MAWRTSFLTKATAAGLAVVAMFAAGMAASVRQLDDLASAQLARIRAWDQRATAIERLRWSGELIVSGGRGYLLSGDPDMLARLRAAEATFDRGVGELRAGSLAPGEERLVREVEQAAADFRRVQRKLLEVRPDADPVALGLRFHVELVPLRLRLEEVLTQLVEATKAELDRVYRQARVDRRRVVHRLYAFAAVLVVLGLGITLSVGTRFVRAYRREREALEAARRAVRARDEIMGMVAHDLRSPLGAIALTRRNPEKAHAYAASIENIARRMEYLIRSMLDVAMIDSGRFSVDAAPCPAENLLREAIDMFESQSASKRIRLERPVETTGLVVRAERERILQVLSNLLGNALKFTPPGGRVALDVDRIDDTARFAVSDTGPGIPAANMPRIFDRFWKGETQKQGTGLGLFIAKGIVDAHGGRIWAASEPGHGATFYFTLPLAEVPR